MRSVWRKRWDPPFILSAVRNLLRVVIATGATAVISVPTATAATSREEYIAQVNPICKDAARRANQIPSQIKPTGNRFTDFLLKAKRFGKLLGKTTRRIASVSPAPGDEVAVKSWIDGLQKQKRLIDRYLRAVSHGNVKSARALPKRIVRVQVRDRTKAANLGLTACIAGGERG
jgi:hypothetical protein